MEKLCKSLISPEEAEKIQSYHNVVLSDGSVKVNRTYADVVKECRASPNMFETITPTLSALQNFMAKNPNIVIGETKGIYQVHELNLSDKKEEEFVMPDPKTLYFDN